MHSYQTAREDLQKLSVIDTKPVGQLLQKLEEVTFPAPALSATASIKM